MTKNKSIFIAIGVGIIAGIVLWEILPSFSQDLNVTANGENLSKEEIEFLLSN